MSTNAVDARTETLSDETDTRPRGRLLQIESGRGAGRVAEVLDVIEGEDGPHFRALVLDRGDEVTIPAEHASWINGGVA